MSVLKLPLKGRPDVLYRQCALGVDLPASFIYDIRALDSNIYPIYHKYRLLWDDLINCYQGSLDDPRYVISREYGELNFGYVLSNGRGVPTLEDRWHLWRWCEPARGWAHIINIDSKEVGYLNLLVKRLWLQARYNDRYGFRGYSKFLQELEEEVKEKRLQERQDLMNDIAKVNSSMLSRAKDNFERGHTKPTNPQKQQIISYPGQQNRGTLTRPLKDREGGLILPDEFGED